MPDNTRAAELRPQTASEMLAVIHAYFDKRGVRANWLCGQELLLRPPFGVDVQVEPGEDTHTVVITGEDVGTGLPTSHRFPCTHVTASRFREDILFTEAGHPPTFRRLVPLQAARVKMLGTIPVGEHLSHGEFREATRKDNGEIQGEATRRWRELGWEFGFSAFEDGGNYFRGEHLHPTNDPLPRPDMKALSQAMLPSILDRGDEETCAKCGRPIQLPYTEGELFPGVIDHRRPVAFGGGDELDNLHLYCRQCNNVKAHTCRNCPINYECERCTWAFPHEFHDTVTVYLDPEQVATLSKLARQVGTAPDAHARQIIQDALRDDAK